MDDKNTFEDLIELNPEDKVKVVDIKFTKSGKAYAYLTKDDVKQGDTVYVKGKTQAFKAIDVRTVLVKDLPYPYLKMSWVCLEPDMNEEFEKILSENKILNKMEKKTELIGRDHELENMIISIHKKRMKNMILVGEAGCGKTTLVEAFADSVKDEYYFVSFSVGDLISGTTYRGDLEGKLTNIFNSVLKFNKKHEKKIGLFIDEIHMIVSDCGCPGSVSIHDMLKTYLTDPDMLLVGATTVNEFNKSIRHDPALMRRMTPVYIPSLSDDSLVMILKNFSDNSVDEKLLNTIIEFSKGIPEAHNPDISIEILDRLMARRDYLHTEINRISILNTVEDLKKVYMF